MAELPVSPAGRRYGRSEPPPMPAHRMLTRKLPAGIPLCRDLRNFCGPVKDQQNLGSCTGHAGASAVEWINRAYLKRQPILSPLYVYAKELIADGDFPQDAGSDGETLCQVIITSGACEDSLYPDASQVIQATTPEQDANAKQYELGAYHGVTNSETVISILGDPTPWPVPMGFNVYASFESNEVAQSGVMPIPDTTTEQFVGGHEPLISGGYDIGDVPTIRPKGCPPAVLVQNSWGIGWGLNGFVWVPLQVLDMPTTDLKIAHAGAPWK